MKKIIISSVSALFLLVAAFVGLPLGSAQQSFTGKWTADVEKRNDDKIQLNLTRQNKNGGQNNFGNSFAFSDLQGLSREQTVAADAPVTFRLVREAGVIAFEGVFKNGKGAGTFNFTPDRAFDEGMKSRGYNLSDEKLFTAVALNLTLGFTDDLRAVGFAKLDIEDLFKAKIFNVTPTFMVEMKAIGFPDLDMEDLVKARIFKIDADFARQVTEMGFAKDSLEDLVKLRIFKITPEFLAEMKAVNLVGLDIEEAVKLAIFKVKPAFVREIQNEGFTSITVEEIIKLKNFKIDAEFIRRAKANAGKNLSLEDIVEMKIFGKVR